MENQTTETQENILVAARNIFASKGYAGARMQEIADNAGINKALLHYYYKSKDKLFEQVFQEALIKILRPLGSFLADDSELFQKIRNISHIYHEVLIDYPFLPNFILNEVSTDPSRVLHLMNTEGILVGREKTFKQIEDAIASGKIRPIKPPDLILNIISLSMFPFASRPIAQELMFKGINMDEMFKERADHVADFVIQSIKL
ncbi:TetR/AcrR family transcriptional regulator [Ancylomarina sp. YFZ004]